MAGTQKLAYAKGGGQWRSYLRFAKKYKIKQWPISEHTLCLYAQYLSYTFHSPKAVRNYLSGIRTLHILLKTQPPNLKDIEVRLTLRGLERLMKHEVKQAQPLTPEILQDILPYLDLSKRTDLAFWGVLIVGFFAMLRKSNLLSDSVASFNPLKQLTGNHVEFKQGLALLKITWAKNIQFRQRALDVPLFEIPDSPLCPVRVLKALVNLQGKNKRPLFGRGTKVLLTYTQFQKKLRTVLNRAGYRGEAFSSHSLRRGGLTGLIGRESPTH